MDHRPGRRTGEPILLAALGIPLALSACGGPSASNGTWIGEVTPRTPGPACTRSTGLAQIQGDRLTFSPNEGTWTLLGTANPDGTLSAEKIQLGANKQPYETRLEGRWTPTTLTATYTTPRCIFDVALTRR